MLSAAQRQAKLAKKVKARKQRAAEAAIREREAMTEWRREYHPDRVRLIVDKREELYGQGDSEGGYTDAQVAHVDAIVDAYTPEEFAAALAQANALDWEPDHINPDHLDDDRYGRRVEQRRQQGRG
jgi:hypothetical protein